MMQALVGQSSSLWQRCRLLEGDAVRFEGEWSVLTDGHVFRECLPTVPNDVAKDRVTRLEAGDAGTDCLDRSCHIGSEDVSLGFPKAGAAEPNICGTGGQRLPVGSIDRCRTDPYQQLAVGNARLGDITQPEDVGRPVSLIDHRFHVVTIGHRTPANRGRSTYVENVERLPVDLGSRLNAKRKPASPSFEQTYGSSPRMTASVPSSRACSIIVDGKRTIDEGLADSEAGWVALGGCR